MQQSLPALVPFVRVSVAITSHSKAPAGTNISAHTETVPLSSPNVYSFISIEMVDSAKRNGNKCSVEIDH